ncbi:hypothetical protein LAZ67_21002630 [Cordylochernes scorpioides]|uniref:CCHC-type domain-containing protein n=1 Tax=Cordylochernes scorpioides TaxID=51811 RepID=A0ABY6LMR2_9ARAC|nr:hypothetical protein LAZ67_21002630 [Cordylochernes scorpioides]
MTLVPQVTKSFMILVKLSKRIEFIYSVVVLIHLCQLYNSDHKKLHGTPISVAIMIGSYLLLLQQLNIFIIITFLILSLLEYTEIIKSLFEYIVKYLYNSGHKNLHGTPVNHHFFFFFLISTQSYYGIKLVELVDCVCWGCVFFLISTQSYQDYETEEAQGLKRETEEAQDLKRQTEEAQGLKRETEEAQDLKRQTEEAQSLKPQQYGRVYGEDKPHFKELAQIGDKIDDGDLAMAFLGGLPEDWDTVVSTICNLPDSDFTTAPVERRLLAEAERRSSNLPKDVGAMVVNASSKPIETEKQFKTKVVCFKCGDKGHYARESKKKGKNEQRPKRFGQNKTQNLMQIR